MKDFDLYETACKIIEQKIIDTDSIMPIIEDIITNDPRIAAKLLVLLSEYKSNLAQRICDRRQLYLFN